MGGMGGMPGGLPSGMFDMLQNPDFQSSVSRFSVLIVSLCDVSEIIFFCCTDDEYDAESASTANVSVRLRRSLNGFKRACDLPSFRARSLPKILLSLCRISQF